MDLQNIIRKAREISDRAGVITFDQLSALCPKQLEAEDVEALMAALHHEGIRLADDKAQGKP